MSREWVALYGRLTRTPKFRRLPDSAQLSLIYAWSLAGDQTPEATWASLEELAGQLELHGRPPEDVDELVRARWLDALEDGRIGVHDWDAHQFAATEEVRRAYEADRKAGWRLKHRSHRSPHDVPDITADVPDKSRTSPGQSGTGATQDKTRQDRTAERGRQPLVEARSLKSDAAGVVDEPHEENGTVAHSAFREAMANAGHRR